MGMIDIHTHILYGVDDGAKTLSDSMELLDEEREQGVDTVIMTPHYGPKFGYPDKEIIMEHFEETIIKHTGFFKKNGVAELIFKEHVTDSHFDTLRESLSIRSLIYYVEIEKLTVMFKEKINEIELLAQIRKDEEEI